MDITGVSINRRGENMIAKFWDEFFIIGREACSFAPCATALLPDLLEDLLEDLLDLALLLPPPPPLLPPLGAGTLRFS